MTKKQSWCPPSVSSRFCSPPNASSTITPVIASGCSISIDLCGSSGRDWNTNTQVKRYSDSGSTHSSGAAATSVEICAVTAIRRPDGTAARKIQRARKLHGGAGASVSSAAISTAADAGERSNSSPQAAIRMISNP
jgi:hypothetical protein